MYRNCNTNSKITPLCNFPSTLGCPARQYPMTTYKLQMYKVDSERNPADFKVSTLNKISTKFRARLRVRKLVWHPKMWFIS